MPFPFPPCQFILSAASPEQFPDDGAPEVAFAGRSNAGKSSALNALTGRRQLARISKTPGRTQMINFFDLGGGARLVDLPGYGYARVPEKIRRRWRALIEGYFVGRGGLRGVILLMDARHPLMPFDRQMLEWCAMLELPCHCLLTKADKLGRGKAAAALAGVRRAFESEGVLSTSAQLFSALSGHGLDEFRAQVLDWLEMPGEIIPAG